MRRGFEPGGGATGPDRALTGAAPGAPAAVVAVATKARVLTGAAVPEVVAVLVEPVTAAPVVDVVIDEFVEDVADAAEAAALFVVVEAGVSVDR